jgi:hypothetical protein
VSTPVVLWQRLSTADVTLALGSRTTSISVRQLPASNSKFIRTGPQQSSNSLTHQPARSTALHWLNCQSQSHIATDGQSISNSWCRAPSAGLFFYMLLTLLTIFYCLRFETSLFVASYDSQGHGLTELTESKSKLCYDRRFRRPVRLGVKHPSGP